MKMIISYELDPENCYRDDLVFQGLLRIKNSWSHLLPEIVTGEEMKSFNLMINKQRFEDKDIKHVISALKCVISTFERYQQEIPQGMEVLSSTWDHNKIVISSVINMVQQLKED